MKEQDKKPENPSAYPSEEIGYYDTPLTTETYKISHKGMTLRDYFAGQTLQGISSLEDKGTYSNIEEALIHQAEYCYKVADAMLKQREL